MAERSAAGVVPRALDAAQTAEVVKLLKAPPAGEEVISKTQGGWVRS